MKKKTANLTKKLIFDKGIVVTLSDAKMAGIAGGDDFTVTTGGCGGCLTPGSCQTKFVPVSICGVC